MNDLPSQTLQQQEHARAVSGEELEVLGKKAASLYQDGTHNLSEAVVETVKHAQLAPEQVRRVVEFANTHAYLQEFKKEGAHKVIEFVGGPANPSDVLKDLNDGGGGTVFDRGTLDYNQPPESVIKTGSRVTTPMVKSASIEEETLESYLEKSTVDAPKTAAVHHYDDQLWGLFGKDTPLPMHNPAGPLLELRDKLAAANDQLNGDISSSEVDFAEAGERLYHEVKQAALEGTSLGDVVVAWSGSTPSPEYIKAAFQILTPKLRDGGVFPSLDSIGASLEKRGSDNRLVNPEHPLVKEFEHFCETGTKLASFRELKKDVVEGLGQTMALIKQAVEVGGLARKGWDVLGRAGQAVGDVVGPAASQAVGADPKAVARATKNLVQYGGAGTAGLGGLALTQEVTDRPTTQNILSSYKSLVPGTEEYNLRRYRIQTGQ